MSLRKHTLILLAILYAIIQAHAQVQTEVGITRDSVKTSTNAPLILKAKNLSDSIINYGKLFLNTPYRYGSEGTSSFDCSGFTSHVYRNFGINLQRSSADQAEQFPTVDKTQLKPGDLVFFNGRRRNSRVGHVGIVVAAKEDGEFDFIHASVHDGVTISNSKSEYYLKRFVKAGRVINNDSLLKMLPSSTSVKRQEYVSAVPSQSVKKVIPAKYHYVKSGETLSQIAEKYGMSVAQLKRKNNLKKDMLQLKQRLKIKDEEVIMSVEPVLANKTPKQNTDSVSATGNNTPALAASTHIVKKGESLFLIAQLYNLSVGTLKEINELEDGKIFVGQEIKLVKEVNTETAAKDQEKQTKEIKHKVGSGETLASIARKYNVSVEEMKRVNKLQDSKIRVGQEIKIITENSAEILASNEEKSENTNSKLTTKTMAATKHKVGSGETLASIARKYNISMEQLKQANNIKDNKIFAGQELVVSSDAQVQAIAASEGQKHTTTKNEEQTHKVTTGETLVSIAKKYNTTPEELKKLNGIENGKIFAGQTLRISDKNQTEPIAETEQALKTDQKKTSVKKIVHKVRSGESLFSISKLYNVSIDDIKAFNNLTSPNLQSGQTLQIPVSESGSVSKKSGSAKMYITHKVGSGETLSSIAVKYGCTIKQLKAWNNKSSDKLDIGDKLKVYPE